MKFLIMKSHRRGRSARPRSNATSSCNRDRAAVASRGALDGSRSKTIDELVLLVGDKLVEYQVLVVVYAVLGLQLGMDREGERLVMFVVDATKPFSSPATMP